MSKYLFRFYKEKNIKTVYLVWNMATFICDD